MSGIEGDGPPGPATSGPSPGARGDGPATHATVDFIPQIPFRDSEGSSLMAEIHSREQLEGRRAAEAILLPVGEAIKLKATDEDEIVRTKNMSRPHEFNLYSWYLMRTSGYTEKEYSKYGNRIPLPPNLEVTVPDGDGEAETATVKAIIEQVDDTDVNGNIIVKEYTCLTTDDPPRFIHVSADELAKSFATKIAPSIEAAVGPDKVTAWYMAGEKGPPPKEAVKKLNPMNQANGVIDVMTQVLRDDRDGLAGEDRSKLEATIAQLGFAQKADGEFGAFPKIKALEAIRDGLPIESDKAFVQDKIDALRHDADVAAITIKATLKEQLIKQGIGEEQINTLLAGDFASFFKNEGLIDQLAKIPDIQTKLFGTDHPDDETVKEMAKAYHLTEKQIAEASKHGSGGLIAALLILVATMPIKMTISAMDSPLFKGVIGGSR